MAIQVLHINEVGNGLETNTDGHLQVKAGRNVTVDAGGVHVNLPEVTVSHTGATAEGNAIRFTKSDGTSDLVQLPAQTVDVHLDGLSFEEGKLKATLSNGTEHTTDFNAEIVLKALEAMDDTQKEKLAKLLIPHLRGDEVRSFNNELKGYLLPTA